MKTIYVIALCASISAGAYAQGIGFGVKLGANVANTKISDGDYKLDTTPKIGVHGGVYVTFLFTDNFGLQPELLLSTQGATYDEDYFEGKLMLNYVTIPVLARFNINDMFSIHAGPQFGFLLSADEEYDGDTYSVKDDFNSVDISGALGLEVNLPANFGVGARYVFGISSALTDDNSFGDAKLKNGVFQIYVLFRIIRNNEK
jgi:hypothetical protein